MYASGKQLKSNRKFVYVVIVFSLSDDMMRIPAIVAPGGSHTKALVAAAYGADEVYV